MMGHLHASFLIPLLLFLYYVHLPPLGMMDAGILFIPRFAKTEIDYEPSGMVT